MVFFPASKESSRIQESHVDTMEQTDPGTQQSTETNSEEAIGLQFPDCHLPALWPQRTPVTSLSHNFPVCKMGTEIICPIFSPRDPWGWPCWWTDGFPTFTAVWTWVTTLTCSPALTQIRSCYSSAQNSEVTPFSLRLKAKSLPCP